MCKNVCSHFTEPEESFHDSRPNENITGTATMERRPRLETLVRNNCLSYSRSIMTRLTFPRPKGPLILHAYITLVGNWLGEGAKLLHLLHLLL